MLTTTEDGDLKTTPKNLIRSLVSNSCETCPLRKLSSVRAFSEEEMSFIKGFKVADQELSAGTTLLHEGENSAFVYTVRSGWAIRYKLLEDGRRQVLNFVLPGDLIGLQASLFSEMEHSVETLTPVGVCCFPRDRFLELAQKGAGLAFDVIWLTAREEQAISEHLLSVGQRTALERVAYVLLYLHDRLALLEKVQDGAFEAPFSQQLLADVLGLSLVHTNKTLRKLVDRGFVRWTQGTIHLVNLADLRELACYPRRRPQRRPFL
ncbi:Crp/Fnr family transcriptional regulator [Rhodospirillum rubrum]|nr:Crp/Fnr family transcriptional regulator [Rhodospirillum rubrum]MBK1677404.1 Crp/Fnr family transcriptional regulator [Rhodospirillum rubrum]